MRTRWLCIYQEQIRAEDVEVEGTNLKISEEIWEKIEKEQKEYFKDQKLIGWCLLETGHPMSMNRGAQELHRKMYDQENTIFIWKMLRQVTRCILLINIMS